MKISNVLRAFAMLAVAGAVALGADVTGKWKGASDTGREIVFDLKADGGKLAGTVTFDQTTVREIFDGKVDGDSLSFRMRSLYGGSTLTVTGKLKADELHLRIESESFGETSVVAKRI